MKAQGLISIAVAFTIATLLVSCDSSSKKKIELLVQENESLRNEARMKDSTINQFFAFMGEIEQNLSVIKQKEQTISKNAIAGSELKPDVRQQIDEDIQSINILMDKNRQTIAALRKKLKEANLKVAEFERMIAKVTQQLEEKEHEIEQLKENLTQLNFTVTQLNARIDTLIEEKVEMNVKIQSQTEQLNAAWYAIGTRRELIDNKVIDKAGGFLGLGKLSKMKAEFNQDYFVRIDITKTLSIPLSVKKANLVTTHPKDSYTLLTNDKGMVKELKITDTQKFWSVSKYLVIEVE